MSATYNAPTPGVEYDRMKVKLHVGRKKDQKELTRLTNEGWEVESIIQTLGLVPTYVLRRDKAARTGPEGLGAFLMRKMESFNASGDPAWLTRLDAKADEQVAKRKAKREAKKNKR